MGEHKNVMKASVLNKFGGPEELVLESISLPIIDPNDIMIEVDYAGVGEWDIFEREGGYAEMLGINPVFPYVLGSEGAGTVIAIGEEVRNFTIGDKVFAPRFLNSKGGFYSEYCVVDASYVTCIPENSTIQEASVISGVGITALRGIEDILRLEKGESILILGASGGVGHLAVQIAKSIGARVFAIASGDDGVELIKKYGIDVVVDGHKADIEAVAHSFAPLGFDAALLTTGGEISNLAAQCVRPGGRIAYPNGVYPEPVVETGISLTSYNGDPDPEIIERLNRYIKSSKVTANIAQIFSLEEAAFAHVALQNHYLGKICLKIHH